MMRRPQLTLRTGMIAVAIIGLVLAIWARQVPGELLLILIVVISRFPYRVRLSIEVGIMIFLLFIYIYLQYDRFLPSHFYSNQADRAAELGRQASDWAVGSNNPRARSILRRESAWFVTRSVSLRRIAILKGLRHGPDYPDGRMTRQEKRDLLEMLWEIRRHEDAARQAHEEKSGASSDHRQ